MKKLLFFSVAFLFTPALFGADIDRNLKTALDINNIHTQLKLLQEETIKLNVQLEECFEGRRQNGEQIRAKLDTVHLNIRKLLFDKQKYTPILNQQRKQRDALNEARYFLQTEWREDRPVTELSPELQRLLKRTDPKDHSLPEWPNLG